MLRVTWKKSLAGVVAGLLAVCVSQTPGQIAPPPGIPQPTPAVPTPIAPAPAELTPVAPTQTAPTVPTAPTPIALPPAVPTPTAPVAPTPAVPTPPAPPTPAPTPAVPAPPAPLTPAPTPPAPMPIVAPVAPPVVITVQKDEKKEEKIKKEEKVLPPPGTPKVVVIQSTGVPTVVYQDGQDDERTWRLYGGFGLYFVQPYFETNPAFGISSSKGTITGFQQRDFGYTWNLAPEFWIGAVNQNGLGFRVRYWQFAYGASENLNVVANPDVNGFSNTIISARPLGVSAISVTPVAGDKFEFTSRLGVLVWDFDITQEGRVGSIDFTCLFGVRYAHVHQDYTAFFQRGPAQTGTGNIFINSAHNFTGAGPCLGLNASRFLGETGFAVYGNSRLSLLYGTTRSTADRTQANVAGTITSVQPHHYNHTDLLPVGEGEIGLEYTRDCGRARAMMQCGFTGSVWWGGGNAANSEGIATQGADNSSNFGFAGLIFRAGLAY